MRPIKQLFLPGLLLLTPGLVAHAGPAAGDHAHKRDGEATANTKTIETDVLIIGGGSTGTYAAVRLADQGKKVLLVEKRDHLGGHVDTYVDPASGGSINVGVQMFHNTTVVHNYFARLGVPLAPFQPPTPNPPVTNLFVDFKTGLPATGYIPPDATALGAALAKYGAYLATSFPTLDLGYDQLSDPVPADVLLPFAQLADREGFGDALKLINNFDQPDDVVLETSLYALKSFGLSLLRLVQSGPFTTRDVADLYRAAAAALGPKRVLYDASVLKISRNGSGGGVVAKIQTGPSSPSGPAVVVVKAKKLLMAAYPLPSNLHGWDLSAEESQLFSCFRPHSYMAGVLRHPGIGLHSLENTDVSRPHGVPSMPGVYGIAPTGFGDGSYTVYYGARELVSSASAKADIVAGLKRLGAQGVIGDGEVEWLGWYDHSPTRLYVSPQDIEGGFYRRLYALQGKRDTWWSGAAWQTQDSSQIWDFTERLLERVVASL